MFCIPSSICSKKFILRTSVFYTSKNSPLKEITKASESAIKISEDLKKLFNSKIK